MTEILRLSSLVSTCQLHTLRIMVARKKSNRPNRSRPSGRRPANQQRSTASSRDGTSWSQQARRSGKANQAVTRAPENPTTTQNGSAPPAPPPAPAAEVQTSGPTFNVDEIKNLLESGMDANADIYKAPKSPTKAGPPASPWAPKRESTFHSPPRV